MGLPSKSGFLRRALSSMPARLCFMALTAFFITVSVWGCAGKKEAVKKYGYNETLNRWTAGKKIFEGLDARLYITATYKTTQFRKSYIERYVNSYQLDEGYAKALMEREMEQAESYNEFFFTAYTPEERWNDFNKRASIWRLYLEDDAGARLIPISIVKVDPADPLLREFFPYFDLWSYGYVVKFPKYAETGTEPVPGPNTRHMKLIVTGILGKGELVWRLKE